MKHSEASCCHPLSPADSPVFVPTARAQSNDAPLHLHYGGGKDETENKMAFQSPFSDYSPRQRYTDSSLDALALRAVLAHGDVGVVHRGTPRTTGSPTVTRFNPIFRFSGTSSAWTAPPADPLSWGAIPDRTSLPPISRLHNRQLKNGIPQVGSVTPVSIAAHSQTLALVFTVHLRTFAPHRIPMPLVPILMHACAILDSRAYSSSSDGTRYCLYLLDLQTCCLHVWSLLGPRTLEHRING